MSEYEKYVEYIKANAKRLNLYALSRYLEMSHSDLYKAVYGRPNSKGSPIKIPQRCLPLLEKYLEEMNVKL